MDLNFLKTRVAEFLKLKKPSRLVVTRSLNQSISIGNAYITLVQIRGKQVRLAIIADKETPIERFDEFGRPENQGAVDGRIKDEEAKGNFALG